MERGDSVMAKCWQARRRVRQFDEFNEFQAAPGHGAWLRSEVGPQLLSPVAAGLQRGLVQAQPHSGSSAPSVDGKLSNSSSTCCRQKVKQNRASRIRQQPSPQDTNSRRSFPGSRQFPASPETPTPGTWIRHFTRSGRRQLARPLSPPSEKTANSSSPSCCSSSASSSAAPLL